MKSKKSGAAGKKAAAQGRAGGVAGTERGAAVVAAALFMVLLVVSGSLAPAFAVGGAQVRERYNQARAEYVGMRAKYLGARATYAQARGEFFGLRADFLKARRLGRGGNVSEGDLLGKAKDYMTKSADYLDGMVGFMGREVELANWTSDEQRAEWLTKLDGYGLSIAAIKGTIASAATRQDLLSAAKELKDVWTQVTRDGRVMLGVVTADKLGAFIGQLENVSARIGALAEKAKANGTDTSAVEAKLSEFDAKIADAKAKYQVAKSDYLAGDFESARNRLKDAHGSVKDAYAILRETLKMIRDLAKARRVSDGNGSASPSV